MDKASPTEAVEDTQSGELAGKFQNHHQQWCVLSPKSADIHIYSQMEYEHNFLEKFIRFYNTTLSFYCLNIIYLLYKLLYYVYNI